MDVGSSVVISSVVDSLVVDSTVVDSSVVEVVDVARLVVDSVANAVVVV